MKYNININQEKLSKLEGKATVVDGAVLDYIYYLCSSPNEEIEKMRFVGNDKLKYTWLDYGWMLKQMPLLKGRTRASLVTVLKRLEDWKFIKTCLIENQRKYITLLPKIEDLFSNLNRPIKKSKRLQDKSHLENLTNNNNNKDNKDKKVESPVTTIFNYWYERVKEYTKTEPMMDFGKDGVKVKQVVKVMGIDKVKEVIDWYLESDKVEKFGFNLSIALSNDSCNRWNQDNEAFKR